jgi:hypothetical protein
VSVLFAPIQYVLVLELVRVLPDVLSANLTVRFQVYGYAALIHRFAKSVSGISGTGAVTPSGY